jgi:DNA-binding MarR family transcriptional regulator
MAAPTRKLRTNKRPQPAEAKRALEAREAHAKAAVEAYESLLCMHARLRRIRTNALGEFGLSDAQLRIVKIIQAEPGVSISTIARLLDLSRQAVHRVVHHLARDNYVTLKRGRRRGRPTEVRLSAQSARDAHAAGEWEIEWMGRDLARMASPASLPAVCWLSRRLRAGLPWRVDDVEDLAVHSFTRRAFRLEESGLGYAVREAVSRTLRSARLSAGMPPSGSSGMR